MDWLLDPFSLGFMQRALVAGLLAVITTSLVGTWVVLRGLSFLGDALAHGVLPGIALGVLLGFDLTLGAVASAIVMVVGINLVHRYSRLSEDTAIGLLFVGMLAAGVVVISRTASYSGSLTGILFGDALGTTATDVAVLAVGAIVAAVLSTLLYRGFLALAFNEQKAELLGLHPRLAHLALLTLVTMAVVTSFRTVGTLLVFGLLVAPPATAALVVRRVPVMMLAAVGLGGVAVVGGLLVSYHANTAASASMAGLAVAIFFLVLTARRLLTPAS
ncbi:MAG TPA: zinc ABC transporter permease AztB [Acidimicrobiia bacterium]|nr:zinc ABC transporter permease AztB [Acidimicrobiia bacterium]